jgi:hypothetical protein
MSRPEKSWQEEMQGHQDIQRGKSYFVKDHLCRLTDKKE